MTILKTLLPVLSILLALSPASQAADAKSRTIQPRPVDQTAPADKLVVFPACAERWSQLPALAERLNVQPGPPPNSTYSLMLTLCDGRAYDFFALLSAMLDRMDKASAPPQPMFTDDMPLLLMPQCGAPSFSCTLNNDPAK